MWRWINFAVVIVVIAMNGLANALPLNGNTTGDLSDRVNVLFTPAGYVFSIWGLIYTSLFLWTLWGLLSKRSTVQLMAAKAGPWIVASSVFNISWLFSFHYEQFAWSLLPMTLLLGAVIFQYRAVKEGNFLEKFPFAVYMGWVSVAFIVNIGIFFNMTGFSEGLFFSNVIWTVVTLPAAAVIALLVQRLICNIVYPLVFLWAFIGIAVERWVEYPSIAVSAVVSSAFLSAGILAVWWKCVKKSKK
ncbi:tryptophan-rich sensory protein [Alkalicoccus urumqiensis]|uniref:Tryptophan-rich sensory protein n=1 Tax=Alkalicoccus urumqiensis TaxID=1548213 RepID=A0A2P6MIQ0_ALKUR|nr:tryptophan-rich sensory protein [Alkalicoccus urumqiensis]PRO66128.1 hypothetical protein C6I21_04825 [Alkalicoccus urumqiensis]